MGRHVNADAGPDDAATDLENPHGEHDARHVGEPGESREPQAESSADGRVDVELNQPD